MRNSTFNAICFGAMLCGVAMVTFGLSQLGLIEFSAPQVHSFVVDEDMAWNDWYIALEEEHYCLHEGVEARSDNPLEMRYMIIECDKPAYYPEIRKVN